MKITKYGHACLLVETGGVSIVVDPGTWNPLPTPTSLDAILITHEHQDHFDIEQVKALLQTFPHAQIITHEAVGAQLQAAGLPYLSVEPGQSIEVRGVSVESCGTEHAVVYGTSPCRNTGFLIAGELFVTGDALHDVPAKPVRILALPTGGPWMKLSEAIDYAKKLKPKIAFPVHDAMYTEEYRSRLVPRIAGGNLQPLGIEMADMPLNRPREF